MSGAAGSTGTSSVVAGATEASSIAGGVVHGVSVVADIATTPESSDIDGETLDEERVLNEKLRINQT